MNFPFDPQRGLIVVHAEIQGPTGTAIIRLALDTGATRTAIDGQILIAVGYDPSTTSDRVQVTTGSGVESIGRIPVHNVKALGHERRAFSVLAHTLPESAGIDGLLGLDFFRGLDLEIDFRSGRISVT